MAGNRIVFAVVVVALAAVGVVTAALVAPAPPGPDAGANSTPGPASAGTPESADVGTGQRESGGTDGRPSLVGADQPGWVLADGTLRVNVTLAASGGTRTVGLGVDADADGDVDVTLAQRRRALDDRTQVSFAVPAADLPEGEARYSVVVGNTSLSLGTTAVVRGPAFRVGETSRVVAVANRQTNVSVALTNAGDFGAKRAVRLVVDSDDDGVFRSNETVDLIPVSLGANESRRETLTVPAGTLEAGTYSYRVASETEAERGTATAVSEGTLVVQKPPRLSVLGTSGVNVSRGTEATLSATVTNTGDVSGNRTVALLDPAGESSTRNLALAPGENATVEFRVSTGKWARGSYNWTLATAANSTAVATDPVTESAIPLRVREGEFVVSELRGNETLIVGDPMVFAANITNTGDATMTAPVGLRIDLNDDNRPESDGITQTVTLAPGEETAVRFDVPYLADPDPLNQVEDLPTGTYIYGVYAPEDNETGVFEARSQPTSYDPFAGSGGSGSGSGDDGNRATRDEISQEKYGLFFAELSGETRAQVKEIYARQPFAGDLGVTDVLTREEIARQEYGLDVARGDNFEFESLELDVQQRIEADFDAQFTRDAGDRIDSWDEISRARYGTDYGSLNATRQQAVRRAYRLQFE